MSRQSMGGSASRLFHLVPKLRLGTQVWEALLPVCQGLQSGASRPAFPSGAWERERLLLVTALLLCLLALLLLLAQLLQPRQPFYRRVGRLRRRGRRRRLRRL